MNGPDLTARKFPWRAAGALFFFFGALAGFESGVSVTERPGVAEAGLLTQAYYSLSLFVVGGIDLGTPYGGPLFGRVLVWEPPQRFVVSWDINGNWKPDLTVGSEVEVRFIAEGPHATLVELEHRKFERMGAEGGAKMRGDVDGGWPRMLEHFKREAEAASA